MATIYQKTASDKCLILSPRELMLREMSIPTNWSHVQLVGGFSVTTASDPNTTPGADDVVSVSAALDRIHWGIKDGSSDAPGYGSCRFIGIGNHSSATDSRVHVASPITLRGGVYGVTAWASEGSTFNRPLANGSDLFGLSSSPSAASAYFAWNGLRITRSGDVATVSMATLSGQTDASTAAMQAWLAVATWQPFSTVTIAGLSSWTIRSFYFRSPLYSTRVRIHNYGFHFVA